MEQSLFIEFVRQLMPKLGLYVKTKENPARTYLHKTMLDRVYSTDQKWEGTSANTTYVSADVVAMDSPLPIKSRDSIATSSGKLPKVGMKKILRETEINSINLMKTHLAHLTASNTEGRNDSAIKAQKERILRRFLDDGEYCSVGIDEKNEENFLKALYDGVILVEDEENTGTGLRVDFGFLPKNSFGVKTKDELTVDDLENVINKASEDQNAVTTIAISQKRYNDLRHTEGARALYADYAKIPYTNAANLKVPTSSQFNEAFADNYNGIKFLVIDRVIKHEKNGRKWNVKPFGNDKVTLLCSDMVGSLVYGSLAEETNPVAGVEYTVVDEFKLISKYSKNDPLQEFTSGQALVLPVIADVDTIYSIDITDAAEVNDTAEGSDSNDAKITINGSTYTKSAVITALKNVGASVKANASDKTVLDAFNALSDEEEEAVLTAIASAKVS